ncbi:hypothetical protein J6590_106766, partial [Homalodisca vitripennis]
KSVPEGVRTATSSTTQTQLVSESMVRSAGSRARAGYIAPPAVIPRYCSATGVRPTKWDRLVSDKNTSIVYFPENTTMWVKAFWIAIKESVLGFCLPKNIKGPYECADLINNEEET